MAYTQLNPRFTSSARVDEISRDSSHYLLTIPAGKADSYRLAQLDDYAPFSRRQFPHRFNPSSLLRMSLSLSARTSSDSIPGTWGFGLWNDPFGMSLGFGGRPFRLPALPNAVWFFGASEENYLSFKDLADIDTDEKSVRPTQPAVNGLLAQSFHSTKFHPLLLLAGVALPFSRKVTRRLLGRVIDEDAIELSTGDACIAPTDWHIYKLEWSQKRVLFEVDDVQVIESAVSPNPPLGLVIWIDNQFASFTPEGKIGFGVLENPEPAWLEIKDIELA